MPSFANDVRRRRFALYVGPLFRYCCNKHTLLLVCRQPHTALSSSYKQYKTPLRDMAEEFSMLMTRFDSWFHTLQARRCGSAVHIVKCT